jgi:hypothetical protein
LSLDEAEGRREAERRHIRVAGTLAVLEQAAQRGLVDLPALLQRLRQTNFRVSSDLTRQMLAHGQGQLFHAAPLASGLGVSGHTVARYLDVLADLLLVRRLQPWARNLKKRTLTWRTDSAIP